MRTLISCGGRDIGDLDFGQNHAEDAAIVRMQPVRNPARLMLASLKTACLKVA